MINLIWAAMILVGIITALLTGHMEDVNAGIIDAGSDAVSLCITMLGIVTMWCGIMKIAERTGLMKKWSSKMPRSVKAGLQWKRQAQKKRVFIKNFKRIGRKI